MAHKTNSNMESVKLVLSSFGEKVVINTYCAEHGVPRSTYYRWRKLVLDGLSALMKGNKKPTPGKNAWHVGKQKVIHRKTRYKCRIR